MDPDDPRRSAFRRRPFFRVRQRQGIPFPHLNALISASIEFFGGICLMLGLATRLVSIPLAFIMLVAIWTAQIEKVKTLGDFLYLPEVLLLLIFVWLVFSALGKVSVDHFFARKLGVAEPTG